MSVDDLISALFDGELNEQERAEVAKKLKQEPATQRERDEIARLSEGLKALPRTKAPEELRAAIRQRIERESLLGSKESGTHPGSSSAPVPSTSPARSRRFLYAAAGLLTSVASLFLMAYVIGIGVEQGQPVFNRVDSNIGELASTEADQSDSDQMLAKALPGAGARYSIRNEIDHKDFSAKEESVAEEIELSLTSDGDTAADGNLFGVPVTAPLGVTPESDEVTLSFSNDLTQVPLGEIVKAQEMQGDQVSIVCMTVVDRVESINDFQVLLQRHNIENGDVSPESSTELTRDRLFDSPQDGLVEGFKQSPPIQITSQKLGDQDLVAVFVTASRQDGSCFSGASGSRISGPGANSCEFFDYQ
ncbi:MAG: hypothetical protein R3C11_19535 [Planctomycetaceae bacterium]